MEPLVSIVIVCMNRMDNIRTCLDSIREHTGVSYETFVVAYMFSEANLSALRKEYPWVKVIVSDELRGFSENNNLALRQVSGSHVFIVNDDTFIDSPVIDSLVADFDRLPPDAAVVSPTILYPDGREQYNGWRKFTRMGYLLRYLHIRNTLKASPDSGGKGLRRTYNFTGAAFLAKTDVFREMGWFDERYYFTPEDIALGTKMNESGYRVYVDSDARLYHVASSTASRMETAIKPARVKGALIFYAKGNRLAYLLMGMVCWLFEALRGARYLFSDRSDPSSGAGIMFAAARNVRHSIFSKESPKEVFVRFYKQLSQR